MKIQKLTGAEYDSENSVLKVGRRDPIPFQSLHNGSYKALVPLKLPNTGDAGDTRVFSTSVPVVVSSETSRNNKGRTRMMVKVTLPYNAVTAAAASLTEMAGLFDPARSGGDITCHLVVSLPKPAADDIRGARGSLSQRTASAQAFLVTKLLSLFLEGFLGSQTALVPDGAGTVDAQEIGPIGDADSISSPSFIGDMIVYNSSSREPAVSFDITDIPGFTGKGIDASKLAGGGAFLSNPIVRGLNGLEPISEDQDYNLPAVVVVNANA